MDKQGIVNLALAHLSQDETDTLDPAEARTAVIKVLAHAEAARDAVLASAPWLDALAHAALSATTGEGELGNWRHAYVFDLPADALRIVSVGDPAALAAGAIRWQRGTRRLDPDNEATERVVIWSADPGPLDVAYVRRIAWTSMGMALADAVAMEMAARACRPVTGDIGLGRELRSEAERLKAAARSADGVQEGGLEPLIPSACAALRGAAG